MDFDNIISLLDEGKVDEVKTAITQFKPQFEKTVSDLTAYEGRFNEAVQTRDKAKGKLKEISSVFGVEADELTPDKLKEMIKTAKGDDASKAEIANLQKLLESTQNEYNQKLTQSEAMFKDKLIEVEIAKLGVGKNLIDDKDAVDFALGYLKKGATLDDNGEIVYRDENGLVMRNPSTGRPLSIGEKIERLRSEKTFLFKATSNGGGGSQHSSGGGGIDISKMTPSEMMRMGRQQNK